MSTSPVNQLWDPSRGIRFTARQDAVVYPDLSTFRFYSTEISGDASFSTTTTDDVDEPAEPPEPSPAFSFSDTAATHDVSSFDSETETVGSDEEEAEQMPPVTSLDYNISAKLFKDAKAAKEGTPGSFWSYTMYRGPLVDGIEKRVKVHYCKTKFATERACQYFLDEKVIGFDLEWEAHATADQGPRPNVSLIQIASPSRIGLFHISQFPVRDAMVAPSFKKLMEDPEITKVGVAINNDATRLSKFLKIDSRGLFELSHLYRLVKYSRLGMPRMVNKKLVPLAKQTEEYLGLPLFKGQDVRSSQWSKPLNMAQIIYSASDAYVGLQLYYVLEKERESLDPCPPRPFHAELKLPIRLSYNVTVANTNGAPDAEAGDKAGDTAALGDEPTTLTETEDADAAPEAQVDNNPNTRTAPSSNRVADKRPAKKPRMSKVSSSTDNRIVAAETWVRQYCAAKNIVNARPAQLRAYYIWREDKGLDPEAVAKLLRDPPLQTSTVVSYILMAIKLEGLDYDKDRLRTEVLSLVPQSLYKDLHEATRNGGSSQISSDNSTTEIKATGAGKHCPPAH